MAAQRTAQNRHRLLPLLRCAPLHPFLLLLPLRTSGVFSNLKMLQLFSPVCSRLMPPDVCSLLSPGLSQRLKSRWILRPAWPS